MAYRDMIAELRGVVPKLPINDAKTLINRAYQDIKRQSLWSFQLYDSNWIAPAVVNTGTATTVQGVNTVTLNSAAATALDASITTYNPIETRQFRVGVSTICNIVSWANPVLTLDRGWPDPSGTGVAYLVFQNYYPAPYQDHKSLITVRDMIYPCDLNLDKNRSWVDERDPQRSYYFQPTHVIPYMTGVNSDNTYTYRYPIYELWGIPLSVRTYQVYGVRDWPDFTALTDTPPPALTEEAIIESAKIRAYEWAEARKGDLPRNAGPDFKYLRGKSEARYKDLYRDLRKKDREIIDSFFRIRRMRGTVPFYHYKASIAVAVPGG